MRISSVLLVGALLAACGGDRPEARTAAADEAAGAAPAAAPPATGGRWAGSTTGGYTGNRLTVTLSPDGARISDISFQGHWDCADGIDQTTLGPDGSFAVSGGALPHPDLAPEPLPPGIAEGRYHVLRRVQRSSGG